MKCYKEYFRKYSKKYYLKNKKRIKDRHKIWREKNKEYMKKWREENKERIKQLNKNYRLKNKEKIREQKRQEYQRNKEPARMRSRKSETRRMKTDPTFRTKRRLKSLLFIALRKYTKTGKIAKSYKYGVDYEKIIEHLKPFPKDLSKYHIDHIKPLCSFKFINFDGSTNMGEVKKAFAPENHQWLTIEENLRKSGK